jgi:hypothetical protein
MNMAAYGIGSSERGSFAARQLVTSLPPPLTPKVKEFIIMSNISFSAERGADCKYRGADKSLARPTSRCILFDGENI